MRGERDLFVFPVENLIVSSCYLCIDPRMGCLFKDQTYSAVETYFNLRPEVAGHRFRYDAKGAIPLPGQHVVIGGPIDGVWYHWLLNWAPRLSVLQMLRPDLFDDPAVKFLIDQRAKASNFSESLASLGIAADRITFADIERDYVLERGWVVTFLDQELYFPEVLENFSQRLLASVEEVPQHGCQRILVSRQLFDTPKRRIANYAATLPVFTAFGVTPVELETESFTRQASLFRNAHLVVGSHGAGLANLLFTKPGATLVLLENARNISLGLAGMFTVLADLRGLRTLVVECEEEVLPGLDYSDFGTLHNRDMVVDTRDLRRALAKAISPIRL